MRKVCSFIAMFLVIGVTAFAFDAGGAVDSLSAVGGTFTSAEFSQFARLSLWMGSDIGENSEFYVQGGAAVSTDDPLFLTDLDLAYFKTMKSVSNSASRIMNVTLGRFRYTDFSEDLLDHALGGALLELVLPKASIEALLGYTGHLMRENMLIALSKEDLASTKLLGPKRIIVGLAFTAPELFARQNLTIALLAQEDLKAVFGDELPQAGDTTFLPGRGGLLDTQYIGLGLEGALTPVFYYDVHGYLNTGRTLSYIDGEYVNSPILAFLTGMRARYYMEDLYYTRISFEAAFASGDGDFDVFTEGNTEGRATAFIPLSQHQSGTVVAPQLSNIIKTRIAYSVKPLAGVEDNLNAELAVTPYFRPTGAPVSETGVLISDDKYLGTEMDLEFNYRPFSDLYLSLSAGLFLPNGDTFYSGYDVPRFAVSLSATLDF